MPRLSISSWSVHGWLGEAFNGFADEAMKTHARQKGGDATRKLLELPVTLRQHGIRTLELCHFHLASVDDAYLTEVRHAIADAGVELYSVLIDCGDITAADEAQRRRDVRTIRRYLDVAAQLGASRVRIDGGHALPTPEAISLSATHLRDLAALAERMGLRVITENWHATTKQAGPLLEILRRCEGRVGLCADTGNAEGPDKYATLAAILPEATSLHLKPRYTPAGDIEPEDLSRCLRMASDADFDGPISLIYGETTNEWDGIDRLRDAVEGEVSVRG